MKNAFVIVNYNDYKTTIKLIENIKDYNILDKIVVVDNKSTDESLIRLESYNSNKLIVLESGDNKGYSYGSLSTYIDYNLEKKEGWGTSIHFINEKPFFDNFPFLGFDTNYNTLVDNRLLYKEVHLKVEKDSVTLMDAENIYIKYVFGSNEMIPKKVVIDYYCDYDFTYHERTLELTLSKIEKYKVADLLKDIYHPDEVTSVTKDNKVVTYYPGEESTIEVLNKDNEIPKKSIILSYILKIVLLVLIIFILVRLFSKIAKKKEGK